MLSSVSGSDDRNMISLIFQLNIIDTGALSRTCTIVTGSVIFHFRLWKSIKQHSNVDSKVFWRQFIILWITGLDRLCDLVVRVPGYRSRGPGFDTLHYQIFWEVVGLERDPLSLVRITEEPLEWKSSGSGSRKPRSAVGICCADHATSSIHKSRQ
jgi:hypothetical protein